MKRLLSLCLLFAGLAFSQVVTFTIAESGSLSAAVDMRTCTIARIITPAALTGTQLSFQHSEDGVTYTDIYDIGGERTVTVAASRSIFVSPGDWWLLRYLKIRSGISATPTTEAAARTIKVICR